MTEGAWLEDFCRDRYPKVVGLLSLYCGDRDVAESLSQDVMAIICRDRKKVERMSSPEAWVHRVAINCANSFYRRRRAEARARDAMGRQLRSEHEEADTAGAVALRESVSLLPKRQRTALVLRYYADLPVDQVAEVMSCAPGTVKALTHKAIRRLRAEELVAEEVTDGG